MNIKTSMIGKKIGLQVYSCSSWGDAKVISEFTHEGIEYIVVDVEKWGGSKEMKSCGFLQILQVVQDEGATRLQSMCCPEMQKDIFSPTDRKNGVELFDFCLKKEQS